MLAVDPQNAAALIGLGRALIGLQRYGEALDALNAALQIQPADPTALHCASAGH